MRLEIWTNGRSKRHDLPAPDQVRERFLVAFYDGCLNSLDDFSNSHAFQVLVRGDIVFISDLK